MKSLWSQTLACAVICLLITVLSSVVAFGSFEVVSVEPAQGQTGVAAGANVVVKFNGRVEKSSINPQTILINGKPLKDHQDGSVVFPEETSCVILFRMTAGTPYEISIPGTVKSAAGVSLAKPYTWRYSTKSGVDRGGSPLQVFARYPRFNDMDVPTNAPVTMVFTNEVDPATITDGSVVVKTHDDQVAAGKVTVNGRRLTFVPDELFIGRKTYEVALRPGLKGKEGEDCNPIRSWYFTTAAEPEEGPIVTDCWFESYTTNECTSFVLHASMENLVKPDEESEKSGNPEKKSDKRIKKVADRPNILPAGHTFRSAMATLSGVFPQQPLSTPNNLSAADMPITDPSVPPTIVHAEYTHGGGAGIGNSVEGAPKKDPAAAKMDMVVQAALLSDKAAILRDSGDEIKDGDKTKGDFVYSGRFTQDKDFPSGQALIAFSIQKPDGGLTEPVIMGFYVMPKQENAASDQ